MQYTAAALTIQKKRKEKRNTKTIVRTYTGNFVKGAHNTATKNHGRETNLIKLLARAQAKVRSYWLPLLMQSCPGVHATNNDCSQYNNTPLQHTLIHCCRDARAKWLAIWPIPFLSPPKRKKPLLVSLGQQETIVQSPWKLYLVANSEIYVTSDIAFSRTTVKNRCEHLKFSLSLPTANKVLWFFSLISKGYRVII